jgi:hypothetical protein
MLSISRIASLSFSFLFVCLFIQTIQPPEEELNRDYTNRKLESIPVESTVNVWRWHKYRLFRQESVED